MDAGDLNPKRTETVTTQNDNIFATRPYTDKTNDNFKEQEETLSIHNNDNSVNKIGANMVHEKTLLQPDHRLVEIVDVWSELPEHIKSAIKALVQSYINRNIEKNGP